MRVDLAIERRAEYDAMLRADGPWASRHTAEALAAIGTPAAMAALMAPLADSQMTSARHTVMPVLETTGQPAVAAVMAALNDPSAVVRANAAETLGWLKPTNAVRDLARLLSDPELAVQAQAAWALGEIDTPAARLAPSPRPCPQPTRRPFWRRRLWGRSPRRRWLCCPWRWPISGLTTGPWLRWRPC